MPTPDSVVVRLTSMPAKALALFTEWSEMIKVEHTVFALPFALSGLILASPNLPPLQVVFWTMLAFAGARSAAMTLNRLIDARFDLRNPRTQSRSIPRGRVSQNQAGVLSLLSFGVMLFAAAHLPPLCLQLSPIAIAWLTLYSYTKRFTWLCHFFLGIALGGAALGGWIAAGGSLSRAAPWILASAVTTWVAGFDLIYACQDVEVDRREHLFSIPACFGIKNALLASTGLHTLTILCMAMVGLLCSLGPIYWIGMAAISLLLLWEHSLVKANDLSKLDAAFFNMNGYMAIATLAAVALDKLIRTS